MLSISGGTVRHCDGLSRRSFLTAGAFGFAGWTLADLLRAEQSVGIGSSNKSVLNIHLDGGPSHLDTIDLKPQAPAEIRGEFRPIATKLPGVQICELMPQVAGIADRIAFIRSLVGSAGAHNAFQCLSGFSDKDLTTVGGRPAMGSVISKLKGSPTDVAPAFVDLNQGRPLVRNSARPGFLGPSHKPFRPDLSKMFHRELEDKMQLELAEKGGDHTTSLTLNAALGDGRLDDRTNLLARLDGLRREIDASGMMDAMDRFTQQAVGILTSGRFADAIDLSKEDPRTIARYTPPESNLERYYTAEGAKAMQKLLLARRVIEAGVRCVSVSFSDFDTHRSNFGRLRRMLPIFDHGLAALIADLEQRGMLDDVSIVVWGEFGRTPKINTNGGRDHWPRVGMCLLAGGGMRCGKVIGATDRTAGSAVSRPVHYQDVIATLYHNLGIEAGKTTVVDPTGRPRYLVEQGERIAELA